MEQKQRVGIVGISMECRGQLLGGCYQLSLNLEGLTCLVQHDVDGFLLSLLLHFFSFNFYLGLGSTQWCSGDGYS